MSLNMDRDDTELRRTGVRRQLSWLIRLLTPVWIALSIAAIAWQLSIHWDEIATQPIRWDLMIIAVLSTLCAKVFSALQVRRSLLQSGADVPAKATFYAYSLADLAKYLPGGIWGLVGRVALYRRLQLSRSVIARAMIVEQVWLVGGAVVTGCLFFSIADGGASAHSIAVIAPILWGGLLHWTRRWATAPTGEPQALMSTIGIQAGLWFCAAVGFGILMPEVFIRAGSAFCLAFAAGLLAPFAPSGIGVREAVVIALAGEVALPDVLRALLLSRVVWIVADAIFAAAVISLCKSAWAKAVEASSAQ